ncbi:MAG: PDZ domain-containing protein, partial [Chloroflexota bacterium]
MPDARRGAALQVVEKAGPAAGQRGRRDGPPAAVLAGDDRELAGPVREELLEEIGMVVRPWLGIMPITITPGLAALYDLPADEGVLVARVVKGNPAAEAGLQTGDIITALAGERVKSVAGLRAVIAKKKLGDRVDLEINRDRKKFTMSLTLG